MNEWLKRRKKRTGIKMMVSVEFLVSRGERQFSEKIPFEEVMSFIFPEDVYVYGFRLTAQDLFGYYQTIDRFVTAKSTLEIDMKPLMIVAEPVEDTPSSPVRSSRYAVDPNFYKRLNIKNFVI